MNDELRESNRSPLVFEQEQPPPPPPPPQKKRWSKPSLRALSIEQGTASGAIQLGNYEDPNYRPES